MIQVKDGIHCGKRTNLNEDAMMSTRNNGNASFQVVSVTG